jgi:hypothetical protein
MNIGLMSLAAARDVFAQAEARFGIHILRYYEECREQDRCLARLVPDPWPYTGKVDGTSMAPSPHLSAVVQRRAGLLFAVPVCWQHWRRLPMTWSSIAVRRSNPVMNPERWYALL